MRRHERLCRLGCDAVGGLAHFLTEYSALFSERVGSWNQYEAAVVMDNPLRDTGRKLKCWQRERACKFRAANDEPHHPADAHDDKLAREIDEDTRERFIAANIGFYAKSGRTTASKRPARAAKNARAKAKPAAARSRRGNHIQLPREHRFDMGFVAPSSAASRSRSEP